MAQFDIQAAMKAGYSQQEINDFLRTKPNVQTPGYSAPAQPFGGGILGSILNPVARYGQQAAGAGYELFRGAKSALGDKGAYVDPTTGETVQNPFLNEQQLSSFDSGKNGLQNLIAQLTTKNSGVRQGLKDTANVSSYAVPFGKGASLTSRALLPGAVSGGLSSLSQEKVDPMSVILGAGGGAAGAGVLDKLGGLFGKALGKGGATEKTGTVIEKFGDKVRGGVSDIRVRPSVYGAKEEAAIKQTFKELKISGNPQSQYEKLLPKMDELGKVIQTELTNNPKVVQTAKIKDVFKKNLKDLVLTRDMTNSQAQKEVNGFLKDLYGATIRGADDKTLALPDTMTTADIFKLKQKIGDLYGAVKDKIDRGTALTSRDKVTKGFRDALDSIISEAHPSVKKATVQQSHLFESAPSLARARTNPPTQRIFGTSVPASVTQGLQDKVGSMAQTTGQGIQKAQVGQLPSQLRQALMLGGVSSGGSLLNLANGNNNGDNSQTDQEQFQDSQNGAFSVGGGVESPQNGLNNVDGSNQYNNSQDSSVSQGLTPDVVALGQLILKPKDAAKLKAAYDIQQSAQPKKKAVSTATENKQQLGKSGIRALNELEGILQKDPSAYLKASLPGKIGGRRYDSASRRAVESLLRARSGAAVPETEVSRYISNYLPKVGDSAQAVQAKLAAFRQDIQDLANSGGGSNEDLLQQILQAGQ